MPRRAVEAVRYSPPSHKVLSGRSRGLWRSPTLAYELRLIARQSRLRPRSEIFRGSPANLTFEVHAGSGGGRQPQAVCPQHPARGCIRGPAPVRIRPWRRHSTGPRSVRSRNSVPLPHSRAIAMALFPLRYPINEANGCFGGIAMHMCTWFWHQMPFENPRAHTICLIRGGLERVPNPPSCAGPRTRRRTTPTAA